MSSDIADVVVVDHRVPVEEPGTDEPVVVVSPSSIDARVPIIYNVGRNFAQRGIIAMNVLLIAASLLLAGTLYYGFGRASSISRVSLERSLTAVPAQAAPGERVLNILLVGSDSSERLDPNDPVQIGRKGERFGDVIILAHLDERSQSVALLSFPRDLWVPIAGTKRSSRINRAFEIGGPATLIDTIETEFDVPIHHYANVDFAGFQGLVEAVGAVEVCFDTPARDWNVNAKPVPRSQTGFAVDSAGCHPLDPPTALSYVRSRYYQTKNAEGQWVTDPTSDFGRIRRQQDFLRRLMQTAIDQGARNPFVLRNLIDAGLENVAMDQDLTPQLLLDLGTAYQSFDPEDLHAYSLPAVDAVVDGNQVLKAAEADSAALLELFRGTAFDHPSTVPVAIVTSTTATPESKVLAEGLGEHLEGLGFVVETTQRKSVPVGIGVVHGPDGAQAAAVAEQTIAGWTPTDEDHAQAKLAVGDLQQRIEMGSIKGRSVQVRINVDQGTGP